MSFNTRPRPGGAPSFVHLRRLTDDTGLLEHALGRIPRRQEGYTTDDNARALWTVSEWLDPRRSALISEAQRATLKSLADIYLAFLLWTQQEDGWFHNNVSYDRALENEAISHDCQGRALWSSADAWVRLGEGQRETAFILFQKSIRTIGSIESMRGRASAMAACAHLLEASEHGVIELPPGWRNELEHHLSRFEQILIDAFRHYSRGGWRWFEPVMSYSNGILPWAILRAFRVTRRAETLQVGLDSLSSLQTAMTTETGGFRPIGNESWRTRDTASHWDQQPLELFKLALALAEGATALETVRQDGVALLLSAPSSESGWRHTKSSSLGVAERSGELVLGDGKRIDIAERIGLLRQAKNRCLDWFYGDNDLRAAMVDPREGSCCDGLQENGPNMNCGAEAALSYLMTHALCED